MAFVYSICSLQTSYCN